MGVRLAHGSYYEPAGFEACPYSCRIVASAPVRVKADPAHLTEASGRATHGNGEYRNENWRYRRRAGGDVAPERRGLVLNPGLKWSI